MMRANSVTGLQQAYASACRRPVPEVVPSGTTLTGRPGRMWQRLPCAACVRQMVRGMWHMLLSKSALVNCPGCLLAAQQWLVPLAPLPILRYKPPSGSVAATENVRKGPLLFHLRACTWHWVEQVVQGILKAPAYGSPHWLNLRAGQAQQLKRSTASQAGPPCHRGKRRSNSAAELFKRAAELPLLLCP